MTIVFLIDQMSLHGGIERVLSIKANYFATQENVEVHIITSEQKNEPLCYRLDPNIRLYDLQINYHREKSYFHPKNLLKLPKHIYTLRKKIKKIRPDVMIVCSHSTDTYFVPFILKRIPKVKEFHFSKAIELPYRENPSHWKKTYFLKFADFVESKYDRLIVLNADEAKYYKTDNVTIIPNPLTFYPDAIAKLKEKTVITAGRIAHVKGYDRLIAIWELVVKEIKDWRLEIYGTGSPAYVQMLQDEINQRNLQHQVILMGATDQIQAKLLEASVFAMTSHNECFPLVLLEAQACGLPIIAYDCPHGPRNIMSSENGCLIPLNEEQQFADALVQLITTQEMRIKMGENARKNAAKYRLNAVMRQWELLFKSLPTNTAHL
ncbi:glycosyltransferase family 4 protein [Cellulophaga sp. Hel_I_12]|uniref:glycosyltransferase family 4 protein n=1 Tax=Cellulophaga sp. Hel_I_12 TaxID=1249972 RepID=UPI000646381B|nr:glycosyltransferase family 4 protein [Cellulophaga sp. Hel_I_12]